MNAVTPRYHPLSRFLHWFMALLILGLIAVGVYMHELPDDAPNRLQLYTFHKTFGVIVFVLVWLRLGWAGVTSRSRPRCPVRCRAGKSLWRKSRSWDCICS